MVISSSHGVGYYIFFIFPMRALVSLTMSRQVTMSAFLLQRIWVHATLNIEITLNWVLPQHLFQWAKMSLSASPSENNFKSPKHTLPSCWNVIHAWFPKGLSNSLSFIVVFTGLFHNSDNLTIFTLYLQETKDHLCLFLYFYTLDAI